MIVKLMTDLHLEFLSFKGGYTGSSESTLVKMPHCWKSHDSAQSLFVSKIGKDVEKCFVCCSRDWHFKG